EVVVSVADNGSGMTEQVRQRARQPFFTTKHQDTDAHAGLGLFSVAAFVDAWDGSLEIASVPGRGTTIEMAFPLVAAGMTGQMVGIETLAPTGTTVLVVEDVEELLTLTGDLLSAWGFSVVASTDYATALDHLTNRPDIDLLITDVRLGVLDRAGFDLAERARSASPPIPVIVVSGDTRQQVAIESLRHGVTDFFRKQELGDGSEFVRRLHEVVDAARLQRRERRRAERREQRLMRVAFTDPLSGLGNRRYFSHLVKSGYFRNERRRHLCCLMADIDEFKHINDTCGHACGDAVIKRAASILRECVDGSPVIRWGGEEFLAIRHSVDEAADWAWAESICRAMEHKCGGEANGLPRVTISIGLHVTETRTLGRESIIPADEALYLAKRHGRNRVCTRRMVEVMRVASDIRREGGSTEQRRSALIAAFDAHLGPAQRIHLTDHGEEVCQLAMEIGSVIGLDPAQRQLLRDAARLHDIGKLVIPESILAKPFGLGAVERQIVDRHSEFGARICEALGLDDRIARMVGEHHSGRAVLASTDSCRLLTSILCVADVLAAMTTDRSYARARSIEDVLYELRRGAGRRYSPAVISAVHRIPSVRASERGAA
ncbi:MAG: diguanylate cyclase, partial [Phycisphaerales bacterium]|nr:diguanylate cyclase [Phycisphaerales bacterium]